MAELVDQKVPVDMDDERLYNTAKIEALRVSSCVVTVIYHHKPDDLVSILRKRRRPHLGSRINFTASGFIIECEEATDGTYLSTVLTHANLFKGAPRNKKIKVDVSLSDGKLCKSKVVACDSHYNLAALRITTDTPLSKISFFNDTISMDPTQHFPLNLKEKSFQLRPHSNSFKYFPGEKVIALARPYTGPENLYIERGDFSMRGSSLDCKELLCVNGISGESALSGGPLISFSGEMIGIMFQKSSFLPSNIISRWWKHYKTYREFRRPWIGFRVANLCAVRVGFLELFIQNFPGVTGGVLVTKVEKDSPAYCSGMRDSDVIIRFDEEVVWSTLEFFEKTWDNVGGFVKLEVLRASSGGRLNLIIKIGEVTTDKFYCWLLGYKELYE